jgi:hypothetical protein
MQSISFFTKLRILFFALLFGQTLFASIAYFIFGMEEVPIGASTDTLVYVAVFASISAIGLGYTLKPKLIKTAASKTKLENKLAAYTSACTVQWAVLEGANLLNIVIFIVTSNRISLVFFLAILLVYIPTRPDLKKIAEELNLNREEEKVIGL